MKEHDGIKEDGISQLPDHLICHILSLLSTKDAVKTNVLSTRWRSIWLGLPSFELKSRDFSDFNTFRSFGDRFFDSTRVSRVHKLKLTIHNIDEDGADDDGSYLASWFDAAAKRNIQHLHVGSYCYADRKFHKMPPRVYNCDTLVCLKLFQLTLGDLDLAFLPCLKTMYLEYIEFLNEATFETLVLCCPVLEDLKIVVACDDGQAFRVHSPSLRRLDFERFSSFVFDSEGVSVDAPRLGYLKINDNVSESFVVDSMESNAMLEVSLYFGLVAQEEYYMNPEDYEVVEFSSIRNSICSFLNGISMVRDMTICRDTFKIICHYLKPEPLPKFGYMSRLRINIFLSDYQSLPTFLESFPKLKSLILICVKDYDNIDEDTSSSVPECLLSSLEFVDFIVPIQYVAEVKLIEYFLKNSAILKKLTLAVPSEHSSNSDYVKKLLRIPRASTKCEVVIL